MVKSSPKIIDEAQQEGDHRVNDIKKLIWCACPAEDSNASRDVMVGWCKTWLKIFCFFISHTTNYECFAKTADMSLFTEIGNISCFKAG